MESVVVAIFLFASALLVSLPTIWIVKELIECFIDRP
jgi:hypothetical protein